MNFNAFILSRPTGCHFVLEHDNLKTIIEATKENWRWIESMATALGAVVKIDPDLLESLPEKGSVSLVEGVKLPHLA